MTPTIYPVFSVYDSVEFENLMIGQYGQNSKLWLHRANDVPYESKVNSTTWMNTEQWHDTADILENNVLQGYLTDQAFSILRQMLDRKLKICLGAAIRTLYKTIGVWGFYPVQHSLPFPEGLDLSQRDHWYCKFSSTGGWSGAFTQQWFTPVSGGGATAVAGQQQVPQWNTWGEWGQTQKLQPIVNPKGTGNTLSEAIVDCEFNLGLSQAHCEV